MPSLPVQYHAVDRLPGNAVAMTETTCDRLDVYLSGAHPVDVVASHLTELMSTWRDINHVDLTMRIAG